MEQRSNSSTQGCQQTRLALLWMNLASEPLVSLYTFLPFILCKDLDVSTFQLSLFITLRPVLSGLSFYWSAYLKEGRGKLVSNLVGACLLAYLPFLCFPLLGNIWYLLVASAFYQLFSRAAIPSLIEILKRNIPKQPREQAFSFFYVLSFIESGILGLIFGKLLDAHAVDWKMLLAGGGLIGLSAIFLFRRVSVPTREAEPVQASSSLIQPWKDSLLLMRQRSDFAHFQWLYMIGGAALMMMSPAFSRYYVTTLSLSHTDMAMARFVFMALGVAGASYWWRKNLEKISILQLSLWVLCGFGLFPLALLLAQFHIGFLYFGFLIYGIAQAGSHLLWHLSGTIFSGEQNSAPYTRTNLLMGGLRGAVFPFVGGWLCTLWGETSVLVLGMGLCFAGVLVMKRSPQLSRT